VCIDHRVREKPNNNFTLTSSVDMTDMVLNNPTHPVTGMHEQSTGKRFSCIGVLRSGKAQGPFFADKLKIKKFKQNNARPDLKPTPTTKIRLD